MKANILPIAFSNSGVRLEEILNLLDAEPPQEKVYGFVATLYRRLATGALLMDGDPRRFFSYLFRASRAYVHFLEIAPASEKLTSKAEAFFDAVACHDEEGARRMVSLAPAVPDTRREYEEDFYAIRVPMDAFYGPADRAGARVMLASWSELAAGNPDVRLPVCSALVEADQGAFDAAVTEAIEARVAQHAALRETEELDPDEGATTSQVSTEVLAWIDLAERAGLQPRRDYPLAPNLARRYQRIERPAPDAWRIPEPFGGFDA